MDLGLKGKWALVCGASKGLGLGCAQALAVEGVNVVLVARGAPALEAAATELRARSQALVLTLAADITQVAGREAAFFGIYAISERGTSWIGPIVFGLVAQLTNSYRPAILALIVFFIVGSLILLFTDTARAIHEAGNLMPEEVGEST